MGALECRLPFCRTHEFAPAGHFDTVPMSAEVPNWPAASRATDRFRLCRAAGYFAAFFFALPFGGSRVFASSSDMPLVSGTTRNTNTNDSAAKKAYMP